MYRLSIAVLALSLLFVSCNNDDESSAPEVEEANFYALTLGNSWEYEVFRRTGADNDYVQMDLLLTTTIVDSEELNDETYYRFETISVGEDSCQTCIEDIGGNELVRDSLGYKVNELGTIKFSQNNTEDYLISDNEWGDVFGVLISDPEDIVTPEGTFSSLKNERYAVLADGSLSTGRDAAFYSDGFGLLFKTITSVSNPNPIYELRLKSFTIQD